MNTITVTAFTPKEGFKVSHRREKQWMQELAIIDLDAGATCAILRVYGASSGGGNTACLWVNDENTHCRGSGHAGGWGYHRTSAAAQEAIENAGFTLSHDIGGRGDSAIEDALRAIAAHLGVKRLMIHKANP